ncbi:hypothetical protein ACHWQZ_G014282 [Mnemiopsis leidyi]
MIYEGLVDGKDTDSIYQTYLDYAKAFDRVDHELLISKLERYGFHPSLISWIKSFLSNRDQVVVLDGVQSFIAGILSGVPQDRFTGDCKLLQEDLDSVVRWSRSNNMQLHEQKSELVVHKHKPGDLLQELPFSPLTMSYTSSAGEALYPSESIRDLGLIISHDLSWSRHICESVTKARSVVSWVLSVFKTRNKDVMLTLYKSLVRSILEFNTPVWNPIKIDTRRERYIILQVWKILRGLSPNDIGMKFRETSRRGTKAITPPLVKGCSQRNQSLYDGSFAVLGARLWNVVPAEIKSLRTFQAFKEKLSQFLATFPDNPSVQGYSCANSNSLLDWAGASRL